MNILRVLIVSTLALAWGAPVHAREMESYPIVKLQSLDKITARTMTFEAKVGGTVKFGPLYIKVQACSKAPPVEPPESAAFLQIWEMKLQGEPKEEKPEWVFSGWMFASSPGLSYMDHPIYDVWVIDCLGRKSEEKAGPFPQFKPGEGEVPESSVPATPPADPAITAPVEAEPLD